MTPPRLFFGLVVYNASGACFWCGSRSLYFFSTRDRTLMTCSDACSRATEAHLEGLVSDEDLVP